MLRYKKFGWIWAPWTPNKEGPSYPPKIEKDGLIETFCESLVILKQVFETGVRGDKEIFSRYYGESGLMNGWFRA
jgi:hypothetical protein